MKSDWNDLAGALLDSVQEAGAAIMRHYADNVSVSYKADNSPVTAADQDAERILLARLGEVVPEVPVIAEEAASAGNLPETGNEFFLVDPLDGTREFINGRDEFTVNIGLIRNSEPVFGMVYTPALGDLYLTLNDGAACIKMWPDGARMSLADRNPTSLKTRETGSGGLIVFASRSHMNDATRQYLKKFDVREHRSAGSSLKFCLLAAGEADLYPRLGPTMEWDTAAGHAILLAAGGVVRTMDGEPLRYGKTERGFLNPEFVASGQASTLD